MSSDPQRGPAADVDAEQEVDFGRYWRAIAARWWLPVGGLVVGLVIGYLVSLGTHSSTYKATAQVYLGQPLAPGGAAPVGSAPTSLGLVSNYVTAESTIKRVARQVGLKPGRLRRRVTTKPITGDHRREAGDARPAARDHRQRNSAPAKVAAAANALAALAIKQVLAYPASRSRRSATRSTTTTRARRRRQPLRAAQALQSQVLKDTTISATDKLLALANKNTVDHAGAPAAEHDLARPLHRPRSSSRWPRTSSQAVGSSRQPSRPRPPARTAAPAPRSAA